MITEGIQYQCRKQIGMTHDDEFYYQNIYNHDKFYTMLQAAVDYSGQYSWLDI